MTTYDTLTLTAYRQVVSCPLAWNCVVHHDSRRTLPCISCDGWRATPPFPFSFDPAVPVSEYARNNGGRGAAGESRPTYRRLLSVDSTRSTVLVPLAQPLLPPAPPCHYLCWGPLAHRCVSYVRPVNGCSWAVAGKMGIVPTV